MISTPKSERRPHTGPHRFFATSFSQDGTLQPPRPDSRIKQGAGPTIYGPTWAGVKRGYVLGFVGRGPPLGITCVDVLHLDLLLEHLFDLLMCAVCVREECGSGQRCNRVAECMAMGNSPPQKSTGTAVYGTALSLATPLNSQHVDRSIHALPQYLILSST